MAKAVVTANEEKAAMEEQRDASRQLAQVHLERALEAETPLLTATQRVQELQQELAQVQPRETQKAAAAIAEAEVQQKAELTLVKEEAALAIAKAEDAIQEHEAEAARRVQNMSETMLEQERDLKNSMEELKKETEESIASVENISAQRMTILSQTMQDKERTLQEELSILKKETDRKLKMLEDELDRVYADADEDIEKTKKEAAFQVQTITDELELKIARTQAEAAIASVTADAKIAKLTSQMLETIATVEKKADERVELSILEAQVQGVLIAQERSDAVGAVQDKLSAAQKLADEQVKEARDQVSAAQAKAQSDLESASKKADIQMAAQEAKLDSHLKQTKELERDFEKVTRSLHLVEEELEHVISRQQQTYCNLTLMHEDSKAAIGSVAQKAKQQLVVAKGAMKQQAVHAASRAATRTAVLAKPHVEKSKQLYDMYLAETVQTYALPIYESHVSPLITKATPVWDRVRSKAAAILTTAWMSFHDTLVSRVEMGSKYMLRVLETKQWRLLPALVVDALVFSQEHPGVVVDQMLYTLGICLIFFFRRLVWNMMVWVFFLPFRVVWFCLPFRFFVPQKKQLDACKKEEDAVPAAAKIAPKGKSVKGNGHGGPIIATCF
eukprot:scaffold40759_cov38-Attheya_sp.AAC.1